MTQSVERGIDWLLRLDYAPSLKEIELNRHCGRTVDALEIFEALEVLRAFFKETSNMVGIPMYRGEKDFDITGDVKRSIDHYFLTGENEKESALLARKNRSMVHLLLHPLVNAFSAKTHEEVLGLYDVAIDEAIEQVMKHDVDAEEIDALVVRKTITKVIHRRNAVQHVVDGIQHLRRRKRKSRKRAG